MKISQFIRALTVLALVGGGVAPALAADEAAQPVALRFALKAGATAVDCAHEIAALGARKTRARLRDARLYISAASLIDDRGHEVPIVLEQGVWQYGNVALINFEDHAGNCAGTAETNDTIRGWIPPGHYRGVSFVVGVPASFVDAKGVEIQLNHSNTATTPPPLDIEALSWGWQAGRKFMVVEVDPVGGVKRPTGAGASSAATWLVHIGSTGCQGDPISNAITRCARPNLMPVRFAAFDPAKQRVVLDLATLFAGSDLTEDRGGAVGCMSGGTDPECPAVFKRLGLDIADGLPGGHGGGSSTPGTAPAFRVEEQP